MRTSLYASLALGLLLGLSQITTVSAVDASLPYRNYPGFVCHSYNSKNECVDFSYIDSSRSSSTRPTSTSTTSRYYTSTTSNSSFCRSGNCLVNARITGPEAVRPGQRVYYLVTLRNESIRDRRVDVDVTFDDKFGDFVSASDDGEEDDDDEIVWDNVLVPARSTRYLTFEIRHRGGNRYDTNVVTVDVDGSRDQTVTEVDSSYITGLDRYDSAICDPRSSTYSARLCRDLLDRQYELDGRCDGTDSSCDLDLTLTGPTSVSPNQVVTFSVRLENDENDDVYSNLILNFDDRDMEFVSASDNDCDEEDDGLVECLDLKIDEDETETFTFTFRIDSDVRSGDRISLDVDAGSDSDDLDIRVQ